MNFLDLHNQVLMRLRENTITSDQVGSDPYTRVIGTHINDAKNTVENAWDWSHLRNQDLFQFTNGIAATPIPGSADRNYKFSSILNRDTGQFLNYVTPEWIKRAYADYDNNPTENGVPYYFTPWYTASDGNDQFIVYPPPDDTYNLMVDHIANQPLLVNHDDILKVPSLPVYTLATAMAARERGEVQGLSVSELFAIATAALSDAIAIDSAKHPEDTIWYNADNPVETNLRYSSGLR
jgi:hypothetical protein